VLEQLIPNAKFSILRT